MSLGARPDHRSDAGPLPFFHERVEAVADFIRYELRLNEKNEKGVTREDTLREAARLGDPFAIGFFASAPPFPEDIGYLYDWIQQLHGRSGSGFGGANRLSPSVVKDWELGMEIQISVLEFEALLYLDDVILDHNREEAAKRDKEKKKQPLPSPKRR